MKTGRGQQLGCQQHKCRSKTVIRVSNLAISVPSCQTSGIL